MDIQFEMGGHNSRPIVIEGNVFQKLFVLFDSLFTDDVKIENNLFVAGCTLGNGTNTFGMCLKNNFLNG